MYSCIRKWLIRGAARSLPGSLADPTCSHRGYVDNYVILTNSHIGTSLACKAWTRLMFGLLTVTTELQLWSSDFHNRQFRQRQLHNTGAKQKSKQSRHVLTLPQSCKSFDNVMGVYEPTHVCECTYIIMWGVCMCWHTCGVHVHYNVRGVYVLAHVWVHAHLPTHCHLLGASNHSVFQAKAWF